MNYDICDPSIRCGADKICASVFAVDLGNGRTCRVLTYSKRDAELLAQEHLESERPVAEDPSLFDGF